MTTEEGAFLLSDNKDCVILDNIYFNDLIKSIEKSNFDTFYISENLEPRTTNFFDDDTHKKLGDISVYINDKTWFDVLRKKFSFKSIHRIYPIEDVIRTYKIEYPIQTLENLIHKHFTFLSSSPHQHKILLFDFIQKNILENCIWSYTKYNPSNHKFIEHNFNKKIETDLRTFSTKFSYHKQNSIGFETDASSMTPKSLNLHSQSAITINTETVFYEHGPYYSEKLMKCLKTFRPFIEVSAPHTLSDLKNKLDIQTFDDLIDETYDTILDSDKRISAIKQEVKRLSNIPLKYLIEYIKKNHDKLYHNYMVGKKMYDDYIKYDKTQQFILE